MTDQELISQFHVMWDGFPQCHRLKRMTLGNDPAARAKVEIDIVAVDDGKTVLVGECKWGNEPTGAEQLAELDDKARLVGTSRDVSRWLFSRADFTAGCAELASELEQARLVTFAEMTE